jgi:hypothetical protein
MMQIFEVAGPKKKRRNPNGLLILRSEEMLRASVTDLVVFEAAMAGGY